MAFGTASLLLFAFIYWQTAGFQRAVDARSLVSETAEIANHAPADIAGVVRRRFALDPHRLTFAALFSADFKPLAGGLTIFPAGLKPDSVPRDITTLRQGQTSANPESSLVMASRLPDGRVLVVGRDEADLARLRAVVLRALALGLLPAMALSLGAGALLSLRTLSRLRAMHDTLGRVMAGALHERIAPLGTGDTLDELAGSVNQMLGELERLLLEVKGVGDDIAHDLRTPLTRLRARLEGGRNRLVKAGDMTDMVDRALEDVDHVLRTMTALLRIGEIEGDRRRGGFAPVDVSAVLGDVADFYAPLAELRGIQLELENPPGQVVQADSELLFEAVANLVDNALKFTPRGGWVRLALRDGPVLSVTDSGPGIPPEERAAVLTRFYRAERSRHVPGTGLGLSLVTAILRLHGFELRMLDASPGFRVEVVC